MHYEFTAFPRGVEGRGASRRLRRSGRAPGVVYGGTAQPQPIELDHNALMHALKNEAFHSSILTMKLGSESQEVLLRDVQMHPFRKQVLHVDFQRVDANRRIHMKVPLHFANGENSPAVKLAGAIISHVMTELDVSCLPKDLPGFIEIDLSELALFTAIQKGEVNAIKFHLKCKGRARGYVEKSDVVLSGGVTLEDIMTRSMQLDEQPPAKPLKGHA